MIHGISPRKQAHRSQDCQFARRPSSVGSDAARLETCRPSIAFDDVVRFGSGCRSDGITPQHIPMCTAQHSRWRFVCRRGDGEGAYRLMLFEFGPSALHFDILVGRESLADPIVCKGGSLNVLAPSRLKRELQILAKQAMHVALQSLVRLTVGAVARMLELLPPGAEALRSLPAVIAAVGLQRLACRYFRMFVVD